MRFSLPFFCCVLMAASSFWISEEAADGRGLALVALWGLVAAGTCLQSVRERSGKWTNIGVMDLALGLVVLGHVLSAAMVWRVGGDCRAAWNLTLEWFGLALIWGVFRCVASDARGVVLLRDVAAALTVGMACYGIWQHHVGFPADADWYRERRAELDRVQSTPGAMARQRESELTSEFREQGIPLDRTGRILWENRVLYSTEPLGPFALANTLAGLLAVGLILVTGRISGRWQMLGRPTRRELLVVLVQVLALGYCLLLTKSRSAWLGALVGCGIVAVVRSRVTALRTVLRWGLAVGLVAGLGAGMLAYRGGLDREVILESPRSLQFRLLYWMGTLQMLQQSPVWGAGPGNFRQEYLAYKVDESSEEIRDPHNLYLEAWSAAGIVGLAGAVLMTFGWFRQFMSRMREQDSVRGARGLRTAFGGLVAGGLVAGFLLDLGFEWLSAESLEGKGAQLLLLVGGVLLWWRGPVLDVADTATSLAAAAGLGLHLLAAGGLEVPVVMMTLAACVITGCQGGMVTGEQGPAAERLPLSGGRWSWGPAAGGLILSLVIVAAIVGTGVIPQTRLQWALMQAESLESGGREWNQTELGLVRQAWQRAVQADMLAVRPRQRWAEFEAGRLYSVVSRLVAAESVGEASKKDPLGRQAEIESRSLLVTEVETQLQAALEACELLIAADNRNSPGYLVRGRCYSLAAQALHRQEDLQRAIADLEKVTERNRGAIEVWLELAQLQRLAGQGAASRRSAERVEALNRINQAWGHRDQFLTEDEERVLRELLEQV